MNSWIRWGLAATATLLGGTALAAAIGESAWDRETRGMVDDLGGEPHGAGPVVFSPDELDGLPAPVTRYFRFALTPGQPLILAARIEHRGDFRSGLDADWSPFHSVQNFAVGRPGFVWDAKIRMAPLVSVRVRDSYVAGKGGMRARVAGVLSVVDEFGTDHLNAGALHRYFLEGAWFPTSLLPSQGVRWEPIDDESARATLTDAGITVSMTVHFGEQGQIVRVEADRMRDVGGTGVLTPFVGEVRDYASVHGMMIPMEGEVGWILPEGRLNFWRGRIAAADYTFAPNP